MLAGMRPPGTPHQLEKRRRLAITLLQSGKTPASVARAVSASRSSVQRWREAYERNGWEGLTAKPIPGRPARLSAQQKAKLVQLLLDGPVAAGYPSDLWTLDRIRQRSRPISGSPITPGMSGGCCRAWAGAVRNRSVVLFNGTKPPSATGPVTAGRSSKKVPPPGCPPGFHRRKRLSAHSECQTDLGPARPDADRGV